ncbi:MAG: undecaprenyl-phosphate glucose phosphotransferase [Stomatobaculum sp.]|nr:undecaprenyl-phosphate glucose phosphotransferase [Stomatobaculum sp.]
MTKDSQKFLNRCYLVLDALMIVAAYFLSLFVLFGFNTGTGTLPLSVYSRALIGILPVYLLLYAIFGLYAPKRTKGGRAELADILKANTLGLLIFTLVLYLGAKNPFIYHFSRRLTIVFYVLSIFLTTLERNCIRLTLRRLRKKGYNRRQVLVVGFSDAAKAYIDRVLTNPEWGYEIRGILDDDMAWGSSYHGVMVIGKVADLQELLELASLEEIAITLPLSGYSGLKKIVQICEKSGVHTKFIPDYFSVIPTIPYMEDLGGLPAINIRHVPLTEFYNAALKRMVDILGAVVGLILFSPVMLIAAILIKISSPGPVIFTQERVGLHQKTFKMYKLRSMKLQTDDEEKKEWTTKHDPRVTPVGRFIRSTSIDEMPQFWNILKGDMSLVGPRPERPFFVEKFKEEIPHYMIKHQVRPGLTGWAQVNGLRGDTSIERRVEYDLYYIENWTFGFDVKILFLTIFKGFVNKNAY